MSQIAVSPPPEKQRSSGLARSRAGRSAVHHAAEDRHDTAASSVSVSPAVVEELGINVIFGEHYGTETLGLKALAAHLRREFRLEMRFMELLAGA